MLIIVTPERTDPGNPNWFYPQRQRCLGCRRFFGPLVIKRLYCSYECAGMERPAVDVSTWPRYCRTRVNEPKRAYNCPEEVSERNHAHETIHVYPCDHCGAWHIGHKQDYQGTWDTQPLEIPRAAGRQKGRRR